MKETTKNTKSNKAQQARPSAKKEEPKTGLILDIDGRKFYYDEVRVVTRYATLIDVKLGELTVFKEFMAEGAQVPPANPIDDGAIRIMRIGATLYEVISGKNQIAAAIIRGKKEAEGNTKKVADTLIKGRVTSFKYLERAEVPPKKLDAEELKSSLDQLATKKHIVVKGVKSPKSISTSELGQALNGIPATKVVKPKVDPENSQFGRIFSAR